MSFLLPGAARLDLGPVLAEYERSGVASLGRVLSDEGLDALRGRADDVMLGRVTYPGLFFQIDTQTGRYEDLEFGTGWRGPSLNYRKIEKLEKDPLFFAWMQNPLFQRIARARIDGGVALYRAVLMTKAARGGTVLPWHQDGGRFWGLDRDPTLQIWTALDDAPAEAGCVEAIAGTHLAGLATPLGGLVPADIARTREGEGTVSLAARAGEAWLIHNHVWHRSGTNSTPSPRRAFTVCYMPAETRCLRKKRAPREFVRLFESPRSD